MALQKTWALKKANERRPQLQTLIGQSSVPSSMAIGLEKIHTHWINDLLLTFCGFCFLFLCAQVVIYLPGIPAPVTGQTFAVAFLALSFGVRAVFPVAAYLAAGFLGAPVFASFQSGMVWGATSGYLLGMLVSTLWIGWFAQRRNWGFFKTLLLVLSGSWITFFFGSLVLAPLVGRENVFVLGVLPFLPGDLIKSLAVTSLHASLKKFIHRPR